MPAPPSPAAPARSSGHALVLLGVAILALGLARGAAPAWAQPKAPVTIRAGGQEATVLADRIQQVGGANELLIAEGNVEITQGTSRLLADRVELNRDTGEAVAQGRAVFFDGQDRLVGDRVDYNLKTGTGVVYNASTFSAPYYRLSGERMDRIGPGIYTLKRGVFTTCEGDEPAWAFRMGTSTVNLDDIVYGQNASFWLADRLPLIPWVPFFAAAIRRERQSGFLLPDYGTSSKKGFYAKVPYYWAISDSQDMTISLDTFTRRGVGIDGEYRYILSQQARGSFDGFFIRESLRDDEDRRRLDIPENRGFFSFKHDWQIMPRLSFKVNANATTDDLVFREYGDRLQDRSRQRAETNVFLSKHWDTWSLVANVLWYQDLTTPIATELQRVPEIRLQGLRQRIPGAPYLLYETEASFTEFIREVGSGGARFDVHPRVFLPVPVAGLFTLTPFVGGRLTYYDRRVVGSKFTHTTWVEDTVSEDRVRRQVEFGFEAESRASRVFPLDGKGGIAALQHVIEPRAVLTEIRGLDQKALPQYDPGQRGASGGIDTGFYNRAGIDNIGRINEITYSITNRLNAKTVSGPDLEAVRWEMVRMVLSQTYDIRKALAGQREPWDDLRGDVIVIPNEAFRFAGFAAYNLYGLGLREASADATGTYRAVSVTLGSRFNDIVGTNYVTGQVSAKLLANLDGHVAVNYDVRNGTSLENRFGFDWRFQCFAISVEYVNRNRNENEFRVSINLLGVGQTGAKMGLQ